MILKKLNILFFCALLFITCTTNVAETRLDGLRFHHNPNVAIQELSGRESLNPAEHFFLAGLYEKKGQKKKALHHYTMALFMKTPKEAPRLFPDPVYKYASKKRFRSSYYDPALFHISKLFFEYREYDYVLKFADLISEDDPALFFEVIQLVMNTYMKLNDNKGAITYCDLHIPVIQNDDFKQTLLIRKASALEKTSDFKGALGVYTSIVRDDPSRWQAHTAAEQIFRIYSEKGVAPEPDDYPDITDALISAKKLEYAEVFLGKMNTNGSRETEVRHRYLLHSKKYGNADRLLNSVDNDELKTALLLQKANYYWYRNKRISVAIYRQLVEKGGDYQREFARICYYLYNVNQSSAARYMLKYIDTYPETPQAQEFLWLYARSSILRGNIAAVKPVLESITSRPENRYYGNGAYWLYRYYKDTDEKEKAHEMFFNMVVNAPDSWYTWIETDRIKDTYNLDKLKSSFSSSIKEGEQNMALFTHFMIYIIDRNEDSKDQRIAQIKTAGLYPYTEFENFVTSPLESVYVDLFKNYYNAGYEEGINGLLSYLDDTDDNKKLKYYVMSNFGDMYGNHYFAYLGSARLYRLFNIKENIALFNRAYVHRLFPLAFEDIVEKTSQLYPEVNTLQIYSVMKAESAFNHKAVSSAGATGLMQIMPATGKGIARSLKMKNYDLKNPEVSIRFGFSYLNWLSGMYKGRFDQMLGGYNAGPGNMNKWRKKFDTSDRIGFAEHVPFYETRHYIFKNQKFLIQYRTIYE